MRTARPLGLSPDGSNLIVVIEGGEQVEIPADERLRAALRNDRARMGQLEIDMESALRPRDIQARIRAGESVEAVAQAAGVPIAKIEPFAAPVIAERDHIAGLAQTNPVRRAGDAVAHRSLRSVVSDRLLSQGIDIDDVEWDAWRTENRRWTVRLTYQADGTQHQADFSYDQTGRFCTAANDDARWLTGEHSGRQGRGGDSDQESTLDLNDELAIVRAIQPQFAVTPDVEDDDAPLDDGSPVDGGPLEDDGTPDNEDAFAEGDLAEVDGVYDIVPGDRSNMDVLYDMLSSFDEDSVQIYAGLVRPRPEQAAAPVLDDGPEVVDVVEVEIEFEEIGEPTERIVTETEIVPEDEAPEPEPVAFAEEQTESDAAEIEATEPEDTAEEPTDAGQTPEAPAHEPEAAAPIEEPAEVAADVLPEPESPRPDEPADDIAPEQPAADAVSDQPAEAPEQPTEASDQLTEAAVTGSDEQPAEAEPARTPRPGKVRPSPAEPEQPSLVDEAANEPSRPIKRKRASVPSWDEIMFGAPKPKA
ncbi:MAG: septation protein SepH [Micropruina sp.]|uniref:septation protein SepH n=1 Tax=Micropruina sp. TaxID=2737536 RepID=UPI0039E5DCFA